MVIDLYRSRKSKQTEKEKRVNASRPGWGSLASSPIRGDRLTYVSAGISVHHICPWRDVQRQKKAEGEKE
jgi:hypothetical protein